MTKKRQILFSVIRGLLAILIALLVATLLIFLSADGSSFSEKLSATGDALKQLLVGPLFRMGRSGTTFDFKRLTDILASMIPIIFTGLSVCVMFSANQFNLGAASCSARSRPAWSRSMCRWRRFCIRSWAFWPAVWLVPRSCCCPRF